MRDLEQVKKSHTISGCVKNVALFIIAISGILIVLIFVFLTRNSPLNKAVPTVEANQKKIILVPTNIPTDTPLPTATSTPVPPTSLPAFLTRCMDVPADKIKAIATGLTVGEGGYLDEKTAQAVRSSDFKKVYFIAAAIYGPGMGAKGAIGIWASNDLDPNNGLIYAIDAMAKEFSDWGAGWSDGQRIDGNISQFDDGGQEAEKCVEYKQGNH